MDSVPENSSLRSVYASAYQWMVFYYAGVCDEFSTFFLFFQNKKTCVPEKNNNSSKSFPLFFARARYGFTTASSSCVSSSSNANRVHVNIYSSPNCFFRNLDDKAIRKKHAKTITTRLYSKMTSWREYSLIMRDPVTWRRWLAWVACPWSIPVPSVIVLKKGLASSAGIEHLRRRLSSDTSESSNKCLTERLFENQAFIYHVCCNSIDVISGQRTTLWGILKHKPLQSVNNSR